MDMGIVVANLTNLIDHGGIFGETSSGGAAPSPPKNTLEPMARFKTEIDRITDSLGWKELLLERLEERSKVRGVLFFAQAVGSAIDAPMILSHGSFSAIRFVYGPEERFTNLFELAASNVMAGKNDGS